MHQNVFRMNCANVLCKKILKKWFWLHLNRLKLMNYFLHFVFADPVNINKNKLTAVWTKLNSSLSSLLWIFSRGHFDHTLGRYWLIYNFIYSELYSCGAVMVRSKWVVEFGPNATLNLWKLADMRASRAVLSSSVWEIHGPVGEISATGRYWEREDVM